MKFILYWPEDNEACVGEVPVGTTVEQFCHAVKGKWIDFGERRHYRTRKEADDALRGLAAVPPGGFFGKGDPTPVR